MTSSKHQKNKVGESGLPDDDDDDDDDDGAFNSELIFGKPEKVTLLQSLHQIFGFMNIGFARKNGAKTGWDINVLQVCQRIVIHLDASQYFCQENI